MSTQRTATVASDENGSTARKDSSHDAYDADEESYEEPTTLSDALQVMQNRMRTSGSSTTTAQHQGQHMRQPAQQGTVFGTPMPWTDTIVDLRCSEPEKFWKPTYNTSECTRPRELSSRPPVLGQCMPADTQAKPISKTLAPQRTKASPANGQRWRADVR